MEMNTAEAERYFEEAQADLDIETSCHRYLGSLGYRTRAIWEIANKTRRDMALRWLAYKTAPAKGRVEEWVWALEQSRWRLWRERREGDKQG